MREGMVSVVIPCFNNAEWIGKCVVSVLSQSYGNVEVIVVDDGSEDNPIEALEGINDTRLRPIIKLNHGGVSLARNAGIEASEGEFVTFVDGDDWVAPEHVEMLIEGTREADMAMVGMVHDVDGVPERSGKTLPLYKEKSILSRQDFDFLFNRQLMSSPCNKIYRCDRLRSIGIRFDEKVSYAEDMLFNMDYMMEVETVAIMPASTYHYVRHGGVSGTRRYHRNTEETVRKIAEKSGKLIGELSAEGERQLMTYLLWGLKNMHHHQSDMSRRERIDATSRLLKLPEIKRAKRRGLKTAGISKSYRLLLNLGWPWLVDMALERKK